MVTYVQFGALVQFSTLEIRDSSASSHEWRKHACPWLDFSIITNFKFQCARAGGSVQMQEDCLINFGGGALRVIHCAAFSSMSHVHLSSGPGDGWTLTSGSRLKNLEVSEGLGHGSHRTTPPSGHCQILWKLTFGFPHKCLIKLQAHMVVMRDSNGPPLSLFPSWNLAIFPMENFHLQISPSMMDPSLHGLPSHETIMACCLNGARFAS